MKRFFKSGNFILALIFLAMVAILITIVVLNIVYQNTEGWNSLLYDLMGDLLSAIVISLFIGIITKIITQKLFSVQINMKKMRDLGIDGVGSGRSNSSDIKKMFGNSYSKNKFPKTLKLMFLVGDVILREFESYFIQCMDNGCEVQLLIAAPDEENRAYLERVSERYNRGKTDYIKLIKNDALDSAIKIKKISANPDNLKIRFYRDEYQNNLRIAKYQVSETKEITHFWINLQPITKPAKDLSIALKGTIKTDEEKGFSSANEKDNLCVVSEQGFDFLWALYKSTEVNTIEQIEKIQGKQAA